MEYTLLETVALVRDMPEQGLKTGDLGAVVELYDEGVEVEFVTADGRTQALLSLPASAIRHVGADDVLAVRPMQRSA